MNNSAFIHAEVVGDGRYNIQIEGTAKEIIALLILSIRDVAENLDMVEKDLLRFHLFNELQSMEDE